MKTLNNNMDKRLITVKKIEQKNELGNSSNKKKGIDDRHPILPKTGEVHKRSQSMQEISAKDLMNFKDWNVSEKIKKELEKKRQEEEDLKYTAFAAKYEFLFKKFEILSNLFTSCIKS